MTQDKIKKVLNSDLSKSKKIIALMQGLEADTSAVAKLMGVRYQFVYNVWSNHCNVAGIEMPKKDRGPTKKSQVIEMLEEGKTPTEIAKTLQCNDNMVYRIRKDWELEKRRNKEATTA